MNTIQVFSLEVISMFQVVMLIIALSLVAYVVARMARNDDTHIGTIGHHTWPLENKDLRSYEVKNVIEYENGETIMVVEKIKPVARTRMATLIDRRSFERRNIG